MSASRSAGALAANTTARAPRADPSVSMPSDRRARRRLVTPYKFPKLFAMTHKREKAGALADRRHLLKRRGARSGRWWWERAQHRLGDEGPRESAAVRGRAAGASRRPGNKGFEADHVEGRDEAPERFGHRVDGAEGQRPTGGARSAGGRRQVADLSHQEQGRAFRALRQGIRDPRRRLTADRRSRDRGGATGRRSYAPTMGVAAVPIAVTACMA